MFITNIMIGITIKLLLEFTASNIHVIMLLVNGFVLYVNLILC